MRYAILLLICSSVVAQPAGDDPRMGDYREDTDSSEIYRTMPEDYHGPVFKKNTQVVASQDGVQLVLAGERFQISLGKHQVLNDGTELDLSFFPDQTTIVLSSEPSLRILTAATDSTFLLAGKDWKSLSSVRKVLAPVADSTYDNGYAGIAGLFKTGSGRLYGIYHAEDHRDMPRFPSGVPGYYATVAMAYSDDSAETWHRLGPVLTSSKGKSWQKYPGQSDRGVGEPSLVIDKTGTWIYLYYTEHSRISSIGVHIAMARASTNIAQGATPEFYKLRDGKFDQPGIAGIDSPIITLPDAAVSEALIPHVVLLPGLDTYLMILSVNYWDDYLTDRGLTDSGIYVSVSKEGVTWSDPQLLFRDYTVPSVGKSLSWGATLVPDSKVTESGWVVYGHSDRWGGSSVGGTPHYLVGRRFQIRRD